MPPSGILRCDEVGGAVSGEADRRSGFFVLKIKKKFTSWLRLVEMQ